MPLYLEPEHAAAQANVDSHGSAYNILDDREAVEFRKALAYRVEQVRVVSR